jgi:hypothetical protein
MTDPRHNRRPTRKQLRLLRELALERGESFAIPATAADASAEIHRLKRRRRTSPADVRRERAQISRDLAERSGGATAIQPTEITGYGSSARWAHGQVA